MIEIRNLNVQNANQFAIENLSVKIPENSFVSILGPNGAGKTTLLKVILGLVKRYKGSVEIFGKGPLKVPSGWIGYVPQIKTLDFSFPAKAIELVLTGLNPKWPFLVNNKDKILAQNILEKIGSIELSQRLLSELSGGELQRIYLARAIIRDPRLIVLDEPTTGIDAIGERDIYSILENYQKEKGAAILMVTHDWDVTYHHSTHVLLMNRNLIGFGSPRKTLREDCLRRAFGHEGHSHSMYMGEKCSD